MTNKQKQCLLCYLGYYANEKDGCEIDGKFGKNSKAATKEFQRDYGLEPDGSFGPKTQEMAKKAVAELVKPLGFWDTVKHFKRDEFKCKCGGKHCNGFPVEPNETLIRVADQIREHFGKPATVSSGVRCQKHNSAVGGSATSRHKKGKAMDFSIEGVSGKKLLAEVKKHPEIRYTYIIENSWVHMDVE